MFQILKMQIFQVVGRDRGFRFSLYDDVYGAVSELNIYYLASTVSFHFKTALYEQQACSSLLDILAMICSLMPAKVTRALAGSRIHFSQRVICLVC